MRFPLLRSFSIFRQAICAKKEKGEKIEKPPPPPPLRSSPTIHIYLSLTRLFFPFPISFSRPCDFLTWPFRQKNNNRPRAQQRELASEPVHVRKSARTVFYYYTLPGNM